MPLAWSSRDVCLLARDGHLWNFSPAEVTGYQKLTTNFQSYSAGDLRSQLTREFGKRFDVSGTGHYLVVHPAGQRDTWAPRFEQLYRSFVQYFSVRGWRPEMPRFPLIAVVFPRQEDFLRYAKSDGNAAIPGTLGYYSSTSNRILLFDVTSGRGNDENWHVNAATIIHEATHQTAFNTGVHSRFCMPPRWLAEGIATMFESRGVWNAREHGRPEDRINRERLVAFQKYTAGQRTKGLLPPLVSTDSLFESNPEAAYAQAWALTFFLVETSSRKYVSYLQKTASREKFSNYTAADRMRDFTDVFGRDLALIEAHFLRFVNQLK